MSQDKTKQDRLRQYQEQELLLAQEELDEIEKNAEDFVEKEFDPNA